MARLSRCDGKSQRSDRMRTRIMTTSVLGSGVRRRTLPDRRTTTRKILAAQALILAVAMTSSFATAQEHADLGMVRLPSLEERKILGVWLATSEVAPCTRSLEQVGSDVFMVNRCKGGQFGDYGRRLVKTGAGAYIPIGGNPRLLYVVRDDGYLELHSHLPGPMVLAPYKGPFPP
jgi:hypothetical protein